MLWYKEPDSNCLCCIKHLNDIKQPQVLFSLFEAPQKMGENVPLNLTTPLSRPQLHPLQPFETADCGSVAFSWTSSRRRNAGWVHRPPGEFRVDLTIEVGWLLLGSYTDGQREKSGKLTNATHQLRVEVTRVVENLPFIYVRFLLHHHFRWLLGVWDFWSINSRVIGWSLYSPRILPRDLIPSQLRPYVWSRWWKANLLKSWGLSGFPWNCQTENKKIHRMGWDGMGWIVLNKFKGESASLLQSKFVLPKKITMISLLTSPIRTWVHDLSGKKKTTKPQW